MSSRLILSFALAFFLFSNSAHAWGKRGHSIICQTAAAILATKATGAEFMKKHSFDLGYYCNVPDLVWKKPATYEIEAPQHFMDLEVFDRVFQVNPSKSDPYGVSRDEFDAAHPSIPASAGRAYWRITELVTSLGETSTSLRTTPLSAKDARREMQEQWLVKAGVIGHYVGDLSQPLHVTENYDGATTNQKGVHSFFEDALVDELSGTGHPAALEAAVGKEALLGWPAYDKSASKLSTLQLIENLGHASNTFIPRLLRLDKEADRKDLKKAARLFEPMIRSRLEAGALALAEIWSRELGWAYDGDKFYNFTPAPDYIAPSTLKPRVSPSPK